MRSERTALEPEKTETGSGAPDRKEDSLPILPEDTTLSGSPARPRVDHRKSSYKNIPEDWKAVPPGRFTKAIGHIEAVLLDISVDGELTSNPFDWKPTISTLRVWADHLRSALKELTK